MEGERSCFNCAVLGKCPLAGKVENCKLYVKSRFTKQDVAKVLGVSERTVYRLIQSDKGRKEMLELLRRAGIRLVLDVQGKNDEEYSEDGQIAYYRKVEFSDRLAQAQVNVNLGARLDIAKIVNLHFDFVKSRTTFENTDPKQASAGENGAASAGWRGAASAGAYGAAVSKGSAAVGENGIACVRGNGCKVKGGIGAILVIAEENKYDSQIKEWKVFVVDGQKIKADTYYILKNGEIVEADND